MAYKKRQGGNAPTKQMDIIKKGFDLYMKPYKQGYEYLKEGVNKLKDYMSGDEELKPMKPRGIAPIKTPRKPNDAIVYDMKLNLKREEKNKKPVKENLTPKNDSTPKKQYINPRDKNMNVQYNRMQDENYDLIEGDKNDNMNVEGDVGQYKGYGGG